ncbi:MAG: hypothetical protein D3909_09305, partial [Candidatus Electrothrix sp. ATG1]|nr:hypothetical protein [Candidatus Electrothrix sp. ATG1]
MPYSAGKMGRSPKQFTRMSGTDQIFWNLVGDQDLFCIWAIASLSEPLQEALVEKALKYLLQTVPILNARPVTTWFSGKWQFLAQKDVADLIIRFQTTSDEEAEEQLQKVFINPINAKKGAMIRLCSIDGAKKHFFVIQVHHLVVDGEGVKRICTQFAEIYRAVYRDPNWQPVGILDPCRSLGQILQQADPLRLLSALPTYLIRLLIKTARTLQQKKRNGYRLRNSGGTDDDLSIDPYFTGIIF